MIIWMISKRVSRVLKLRAQIPRSLPHQGEGTAAFLITTCFKYMCLSWLVTNISSQIQICYPAYYWIETLTQFCQNLSLFLPQLRLTASQTKISGPKIMVSRHMLVGTSVTDERKEQCQVKLVMLTFTEWLGPPTPFDALTPEFQRLGWTLDKWIRLRGVKIECALCRPNNLLSAHQQQEMKR